MRGCECEHTKDGRCGYTLWLPATGNTADGATCPPQEDVSEELSPLQDSIENLTGDVARHSQMISDLQSSVVELQSEALKRLMNMSEGSGRIGYPSPTTGNDGGGDDGGYTCTNCEDMDRNMSLISRKMGRMQIQIADLQEKMERTEGQMIDIVPLVSSLSETGTRLNELLEAVNGMDNEIRRLKFRSEELAPFQCVTMGGLLARGVDSRRPILVKGPMKKMGPDEELEIDGKEVKDDYVTDVPEKDEKEEKPEKEPEPDASTERVIAFGEDSWCSTVGKKHNI